MWTNAPGDVPQSWDPAGVDNGDGTWDYDGSLVDPDGHWTVDWDMTVDPDPYVSAGYSVLNTFSTTLIFNVITTLPVAPMTINPLMGGSTGGSVTDANFDSIGTAATTNGIAFYEGLIDGAAVLPLHPDPSGWTVPYQGGTANITAIGAGLPGPTLTAPAVSTDIGIHHQFTLTPGDRVSLTSFFVVVPEPSSLGLLTLGALAVLRRRR
ncbi:MAG TPA: PEP-CTERM sorting domain-containing protein [Phycisphaerae bacterium]|nr:PEP-CTERM sorting domain-containing protein [Phycisphaerae bacterium]